MKYYAAQLIYKVHGATSFPDQYLLELRMVHACEEREALQEARRLGEASQLVPGATAERQFIGVKSLEAINLSNGALVFREVREYQCIETG